MNLHGQIINMTADAGNASTDSTRIAYLEGHRDARHVAAELALKADAAMQEAAQIIKEICQCYCHPTPDATLARLLGEA